MCEIIHIFEISLKTCPIGVADRCNLGLIPSSEASWIIACRALKSEGGRLHLHGIANEIHETHQQWAENVRNNIETIMNNIHQGNGYSCELEHIERVKIYGPHLDHLVADLNLKRV